MAAEKKGILERLKEGPVIGDGGFVFSLEKRGYVKAGPWTPEATLEHPEAVRQLHREFLRAGSDVMQTFTFYASDDKLENRGNVAQKKYTGSAINQAACDLAKEVADEGNALVAGGICQTPTYLSAGSKEEVQKVFKIQLDVFKKNKVDFMICEYFEHVEEAVWAVEVCKAEMTCPIAATLCVGPEGDMHGVSAADCAVKLAKAGAEIIGVNCHFDPMTSVEAARRMGEGLKKAGLEAYLMTQPLAYHTPDVSPQGFIDLPEFPFGLEPRVLTRWECHQYAREAWKAGVRYIGACCGFEPYHVRAIAEELAEERGKKPAGSDKHGMWGAELAMHTKPWVRSRANRAYWEKLQPASGRPFSASYSTPDKWGITQGDAGLKQQTEATSKEELEKLKAKRDQ